MRYGYWWIGVLLSVVFIVAVFWEDFKALRVALHTDVILLGILLITSALVGYWYVNGTKH